MKKLDKEAKEGLDAILKAIDCAPDFILKLLNAYIARELYQRALNKRRAEDGKGDN